MTNPESHIDFLDKPVFWHVATIGPAGEPQSSPVWAGADDDGNVIFSALKRRQKVRNLEANPAIAMSAYDHEAGYRHLEIRGTVIAIDDDPENVLIDQMAKKYLDLDEYPWGKPEDERVIIRIRVDRANAMG